MSYRALALMPDPTSRRFIHNPASALVPKAVELSSTICRDPKYPSSTETRLSYMTTHEIRISGTRKSLYTLPKSESYSLDGHEHATLNA